MHAQRRKNSSIGARELARLPVSTLRSHTRRQNRHTPPLPQQRGASRRVIPPGPKGGGSGNAETSTTSAPAMGLQTTLGHAAEDASEASRSEAVLQTGVPRRNPSVLYTARDKDTTPTTAGPSRPSKKNTLGGRQPSPQLRGPPRSSLKIAGYWLASGLII